MTSTASALPQASPKPPRGGPVRPSRRSRLRTAVLVTVHLLIVAHVVHWLVTGSSLAPIEPSESMQTLERGVINVGFIFFVVTILSTLILGRWFCGWACHVVAYQDLAAWLLGKVGLRPQPIRSRLLVWAPTLLAFYMFVWPQFLRAFADDQQFPGFSASFTTERLWESFAGPGMAVVTLFVCGAIVVYWLGAKGFCTYGCPYGAAYAFADRFATGRIRVTDACKGCRHCTATCTSNVVVHEEVLRHGMVVDPGCMKCTDCVDVCPENALYFGFGKPSPGFLGRSGDKGSIGVDVLVFIAVFVFAAWWVHTTDPFERLPTWFETTFAAGLALLMALTGRRAPAYDFSRNEELVMAAVFLLSSQWAFRGLYELVPNLLAIGLGALTAFGLVFLWRALTNQDLRLQHHVLRRGGAWTRAGVLFAIGMLAWLGFTAHSAIVQRDLRIANIAMGQAAAMDQGPARQEKIRSALPHLDDARDWSLIESSKLHYMRGEVLLGLGKLEDAEGAFARSAELRPESKVSWQGLVEVRSYLRDLPGTIEALREILELEPDDESARQRLEMLRGMSEQPSGR